MKNETVDPGEQGSKKVYKLKNFKPASDDTPPARPPLHVKAKLITGGDPNALFTYIPPDTAFEDEDLVCL